MVTDSDANCFDSLDSAKAFIQKLQEELKASQEQIALLRDRVAELEKLAITDEMTGLYNQRHFYNILAKEIAKSKEKRLPLCLMFFDVDGLKTYNDTYGHLGGDDVLQAVAESVSRNMKGFYSGYRYGGDEFAVIVVGKNSEVAVDIARNINKDLRNSGFQHVSLSFGIAEFSDDMDGRTLIRHADDAMYMAKRGREIAALDGLSDKIYVY